MYYLEGQVPAQEMLRAQDLNHRKKMNPSEKASLSCHPSRTWSPVGYYWSLGKDTFQAQPKVQQSPSMQTAMTVCNYCPALIPGNRGISCTSLVHACVRRSMWRIFLVGGWATHLHESIGITFLGLQCCKNTLKPATRSSLLVYPWCTQ
jgi:hypothetical protein